MPQTRFTLGVVLVLTAYGVVSTYTTFKYKWETGECVRPADMMLAIQGQDSMMVAYELTSARAKDTVQDFKLHLDDLELNIDRLVKAQRDGCRSASSSYQRRLAALSDGSLESLELDRRLPTH